MANQQIGWSEQTKLLQQILKQLERLTKIVATTNTTTTAP